MEVSIFTNQIIFNRNDSLPALFKLNAGVAAILDPHGRTLKQLTAPSYLNLIEELYHTAALKTVKSQGKCQITKIKVKDSHRAILNRLKERGLRKDRFPAFQTLSCPAFYELLLHCKEIELNRGRKIQTVGQNLYLVVEGAVVAEGANRLKMLRLGQGEVLLGEGEDTWLVSEKDTTLLLQMETAVAQTILGPEWALLSQISHLQKQTLREFARRNKQIAKEISRERGRLSIKVSASFQFRNKIEEKWDKLEKYVRVRSSFSQSSMVKPQNKEDALKENKAKFKELMDLNRRRYGKEYIYNKRLEISRKVHSLSAPTSPTASPPHAASSGTLKPTGSVSIYETASLRDHYGIMRYHPEIQKSKRKKMHRGEVTVKGLRKVKCDFDKTKLLFVSCLRSKHTPQID